MEWLHRFLLDGQRGEASLPQPLRVQFQVGVGEDAVFFGVGGAMQGGKDGNGATMEGKAAEGCREWVKHAAILIHGTARFIGSR